MKTTALTIFIVLNLLFPLPTLAVSSNQFVTKVGDPKEPNPGAGNFGLLKAGQDLVDAYRTCNRGSTGNDTSLACLVNFLKTRGYSDQALDAFKSRYGSGGPGYCIQCVGFIALSLSLISNDSNTLKAGVSQASNIYNFSYIKAGSLTFTPIGVGNSVNIQPGDIGVTTEGSAGHILIVKSVAGGVEFIGLEANFGIPSCRATDDQDHFKRNYKFFRQ